MKKTLILFSLIAVAIGCKNEKVEDKPVLETETIAMNYQTFGEKITDENVLNTQAVIKRYNDLKIGDTVNVKFASQVKEVCQKKGCWMKVDLGEDEAMVRFKDYGFFMPKDIAGKEIIAEGKAYVEEMSIEDQRHYAEDGGATAEEIAAITEVKRTLAFEAHGVLIPEEEKH
ncbi:DUF4920 domain-containing protein [Aequorivita flava]|uniref:DUF4920 domain-containing protein n=1 Tax=Aequorivita flava TaxID=3114371 RepID=A0AB35YRA2_9FLAO